MNTLIASYLIQQGHVKLAGIGQLEMLVSSAVSDVASKVIYAPETKYSFREDADQTSEEFIAYISYKIHSGLEYAKKTVQEWIDKSIQQLNNHNPVIIPTIGKLIKNDEGMIVFQPVNSTDYLIPVPAERVIHEKDTHRVLVGDVESDSQTMNQLLNPETILRNHAWWKAALILFIITLVLFVIYYFSGGFGLKINAEAAPATYIPK